MNAHETILTPQIRQLISRGIKIINPSTVAIGPEVRIERICHPGVEIHGPAQIKGEHTSLGPDSKVGTEGPITIFNCQLGSGVELAAGSFTGSVFLDRTRMGPSAHIREACLLEEEASGAHCVGLKQTVLFPFVTLGSLINFCDCLMAGGTSRKNHSEVGSSFIHFNFTPNQDKATCSLLGDVPRGVMLHESPIFLGGQGGIVGPIVLGYGTVTKAGTILRRDDPAGGNIWGPVPDGQTKKPFHPGLYVDLNRRIRNNVLYIANILALRVWYRHVRTLFFTDLWERALLEGALTALQRILQERCYRLGELAEKMETCIKVAEQEIKDPTRTYIVTEAKAFQEKWPLMEKVLKSGLEEELGRESRIIFQEKLSSAITGDYLSTIKSLTAEIRQLGIRWLKEIVDGITEKTMALIISDKNDVSKSR